MRNVPLPFVPEDTVQHLGHLYGVRAQAEQVAAPLALDADIVAQSWPEIERHKWVLSEKLGRDVGARVATLDFFENIEGARASRRGYWSRLWQSLLHNLDADGPHSIVQFERAMQGTRSLAQ